MTIKILGIGGSLRQPSNSLTCLNLAMAAASEAGAEVEIFDLYQYDFPFYRDGWKLKDYPQAEMLQNYLAKVQEAQALIFSSPAYHGTISGSFKNAVDFFEFLPRRPTPYLSGKIVGLIAVGSGQFAAVNSMTALLHFTRTMRGIIAPASVAVPNAKKIFDSQGQLQDERVAEQLRDLGREVVALVR